MKWDLLIILFQYVLFCTIKLDFTGTTKNVRRARELLRHLRGPALTQRSTLIPDMAERSRHHLSRTFIFIPVSLLALKCYRCDTADQPARL